MGGERDEGRRREVEREDEWKVMFWNVAGLRNKDVEFWKGLENWDGQYFRRHGWMRKAGIK